MSRSRRRRTRIAKKLEWIAKTQGAKGKNGKTAPVNPPTTNNTNHSRAMSRRKRKAARQEDPNEAYDFDIFSCSVLSSAVTCVLSMGGTVNWDRITKFLMHNSFREENPDGISEILLGCDTYIMESTIQRMFKSLTTYKRRPRR